MKILDILYKPSKYVGILLLVVAQLIFSFGIVSCKKINRSPKIVTSPPTNISDTAVKLNATVIELNSDLLCENHGFFFSDSSANPTEADESIFLGTISKKVKVSYLAKELKPKTKYYYRSFIFDKDDYVLGKVVSFSTTGDSPTVETLALENITDSTVTCVARVISDAGFSVTERGICWSKTINPTIVNKKQSSGSGTGEFSSNISKLLPNQKYFLRAYATNAVGTAYGQELSFTTGKSLPSIALDSSSTLTSTSAMVHANVLGNGGTSILERGFCLTTTSYASNCWKSIIEGAGNGPFSSNFTGLNSGQTYYCRAFAKNAKGIQYSNEISFTTKSLANVKSVEVSTITTESASITGTIDNDGGLHVTERGFCLSKQPTPSINNTKVIVGEGSGTFNYSFNGLVENQVYYVRAYAINELGISYGNILTFSTLLDIPVVSTISSYGITASKVFVRGQVISGVSNTTSRGICYSKTANPTINDNIANSNWTGSTSFQLSLDNLSPNTTYYFRAFATNSSGTGYGNVLTFKTLAQIPTVTTNIITDIAPASATGGGNVTNDGGAAVTEKGICWSTSNNPTISDSKTVDGGGIGSYSSAMSGLVGKTTYYVRAYAKNSMGIAYGNEVSFSFKVGITYGGGVVYYIDQTGIHGLIAAESDQSSSAPFGCERTRTYSTGSNFGAGQNNTNQILSACSSSGIAAEICNDLVLNNYSDWYLPSLYELQLLYNKRDVVGGFSSYYYWSSTEFHSSSVVGGQYGWYAYEVYFKDGTTPYYYKNTNIRVRAIRKF